MSGPDGKIIDEMSRGARARALMGDELMVEIFQKLRGIYSAQWAGCPDAAVRDRIWLKVQALGDVEGDLLTMIETGKLASVQMQMPPTKRLDA
jgi:hypothetical protein